MTDASEVREVVVVAALDGVNPMLATAMRRVSRKE
jgi:hypothetical protein